MRLISTILMIQFWACIDLVQSAECNVDTHHPENGGYYIEGINGVDNEVDPNAVGKRKMTNSTWATGIEYPDGSLTFCTGPYCSETCRNDGCFETIPGTTCSMIRFCYEADSGSDVWILPDEKAFQQCDFSSATQICDTDGGSGEDCCNHKVELADDIKVYFFASKEGCGEGQRTAVAIDDYNKVTDPCFVYGQTTERINKCTCSMEDRELSILNEPCHSQFIAGCLSYAPDLGDDTSCCDDGSCVGKHQDVQTPIGLAIEAERKQLCRDDLPGRCLSNEISDCCNSQCSECGTDVTPFTKWNQCTSGNATAGTGNCGAGRSPFECDFTKCTEDHKWHMAGEAYSNWMKSVDLDNYVAYVAPTVNDDVEAPNPGACYDTISHQCGCGATCNAELCAAAAGVWSSQCSDHCKECNVEAAPTVNDDVEAPNPGACYDTISHQCGCGATCNAELCAAAAGVWTSQCSDHCKECNVEEPDTNTPPSTAPEPPAKPSSDSSMVEEEESFASATVLHGLTIAISFGMLVSLL